MIEIKKLGRFLNVFYFSRLFTEQRNPADVHCTRNEWRMIFCAWINATWGAA
jgi:hypothetical protein